MQWYRCPKCNQFVQYGTLYCPTCGCQIAWGNQPVYSPKPQPTDKPKPNTVVIVFTVLIGVFLVLGGICSVCSKNTPSPQTPMYPAITISAASLSDAYDANEVAADLKYKNKTVQVTGIITSIGSDLLSEPYITLADEIQCSFPSSSANQIAGLSKGQFVTVQGKCTGKGIFTIVLLDCVLK